MKALIGTTLALTLISSIGPIRAAEIDHCKDVTDIGEQTFVKTGDDAKRIAFAMWHTASPDFTREDEKVWASGFTATLRQCVWEVTAKPVPPETYGTFKIQIGARDGRFLGAVISD